MKLFSPSFQKSPFTLLIGTVLISTCLFSQTISYKFDGKSLSFKSVYKAELSTSSEEINIYLLEEKLPDLDKIQDGELIHHPEAMNLMVAGITESLPIEPSSKIVLSSTAFERGTSEYNQAKQLADETSKVMEASKPKMEAAVKKREEKIKKLTKRVQNGDMAAMEELQQIAAELEAIISGEMDKLPDEEIELTSQYFDILVNMPSEDASRWQNIVPISGNLTIDQLSDTRLKASFSGMAIYESDDLEDAKPLTISWNVPLTTIKN